MADGLPSPGGSSTLRKKPWTPLSLSMPFTRVSPLPLSPPSRVSLALVSSLLALSFLFAGLLSLFVPRPSAMAAKSSEALTNGGIIGDVLDPFFPSVTLKVDYRGRDVTDGVELKPSETALQPTVEIADRNSKDLYTLVMVDPDAPSPDDPTAREWLHWIVTNIPGASTVPGAGTVVVDYNGPTPPIGIHRYVFVLFKQNERLDVIPPENRKNFNTRSFSVSHDLGLPVSAVYFRAQKEVEPSTRRR